MKVLIIDDEEFFARNLCRYLQNKTNFCLRYVTSVKKALTLVRTENFDLVICDLKMSDLPAGELVKKISAVKPGQPFVIMSALEIPNDLLNNEDINVIGYFEKPFNMNDLEKILSEQLSIAKNVNNKINPESMSELKNNEHSESSLGKINPKLIK